MEDLDILLRTVVFIRRLAGDFFQYIKSLRQFAINDILPIQMVGAAHGRIRLALHWREYQMSRSSSYDRIDLCRNTGSPLVKFARIILSQLRKFCLYRVIIGIQRLFSHLLVGYEFECIQFAASIYPPLRNSATVAVSSSYQALPKRRISGSFKNSYTRRLSSAPLRRAAPHTLQRW